MDIEAQNGFSSSLGPVGFEGSEESRQKTPLRMLYAAEVKVFKSQHGNLEEIRLKLGFSRRKMCQLLMVDPSAWTRWMKDENKVPPHIYRALEWYLALNQKALTHPDLAAIFTARYQAKVRGEERDFSALERELATQKTAIWCLIGGLGAVSLGLLFMSFWH